MWKEPPPIKVYEALGAVADGRIKIDGNTAQCYSSSGNKYYDVSYDPEANAIMANDNGSYWQGYLGYPAIAYLLASGRLDYREAMGELLRGVAWKDINQKFKNDFERSLDHILKDIDPATRTALEEYAKKLHRDISILGLARLVERALPPKGY